MILILVSLLLLPIIYNLLFPLKPPRLDHYFQSGQTFHSKAEGVTQTVVRQEGSKVYTQLLLAPGCAGPPSHVHEHFDETFTVTKGVLTATVNGETKELKAGERVILPKGHYHSFCNKTNEEVIVSPEKEEDYLPMTFAYTLSKFYAYMDSDSKLKVLHMLFKMSIFGDLFDSYIEEAPVKGQKVIKAILRPYARVLGYKLYDDKSRPV